MEKKKAGFSLRVNEEITTLFKQYGKPKKFVKGDVVVKQGDYSSHVYIVLTGEAEVVRIDKFGNENKLAVLSSGSIVGEMGAFLNNQRSATVKAHSDILFVLECPNQMFIRGLFSTHELTYRVLTNYAERINDLNITVSMHYQARVMLVVGHYIISKFTGNDNIQEIKLILSEIDEMSGLETYKIIEALYNFKALRAVEKLILPPETHIIEVEVDNQNIGDETDDDGGLVTVKTDGTEPGIVTAVVNKERFREQIRRLSYV